MGRPATAGGLRSRAVCFQRYESTCSIGRLLAADRQLRRTADGDERHQPGRRLHLQERLEPLGGHDRSAGPAGRVAHRVRRRGEQLDGGSRALQLRPHAHLLALLGGHAAQLQQLLHGRDEGQRQHRHAQRGLGEQQRLGARHRPLLLLQRQPRLRRELLEPLQHRALHLLEESAILDGDEAPRLRRARRGGAHREAGHVLDVLARHEVLVEVADVTRVAHHLFEAVPGDRAQVMVDRVHDLPPVRPTAAGIASPQGRVRISATVPLYLAYAQITRRRMPRQGRPRTGLAS